MLDLAIEDYRALAEFRSQIRRFLRFSEQAARAADLEPQQHQLLLAVKGQPDGEEPTVGALAERLQLQPHSALELVDRLVERGLVARERDPLDRRRVLVRLTPEGEAALRHLTLHHWQELRTAGPALVAALEALLPRTGVAPRLTVAEQRRGRQRATVGVAQRGEGWKAHHTQME